MDEPGRSWPAWKFGMKREHLSTILNEQYNTFPSSIQDPDAFHHDVYEISNEASTRAEFHELMAARRELRLRELNESLDLAAVEIIANPSLIGTSQWEHALQLFRTRSLDSLVRFFAAYLPANHPWHRDDGGDVSSAETPTKARAAFFDSGMLTHEPDSLGHSLHHLDAVQHDLPPSPRSLTMCSDESHLAISETFSYSHLSPSRTLSLVSDDDEQSFGSLKAAELHFLDDASSQSSGPDTPASASDNSCDEKDVDDERSPKVGIASSKRHDDEPHAHDDHHTYLDSHIRLDADSLPKKENHAAAEVSATPPTPLPAFSHLHYPRLPSFHAAKLPSNNRPALRTAGSCLRSRSLSPPGCASLVECTAEHCSPAADCRKPAPQHRASGRPGRPALPSRLDAYLLEPSDKRRRGGGLGGAACRRDLRDLRDRKAASRIQKPRPMWTRLRERREREASDSRC